MTTSDQKLERVRAAQTLLLRGYPPYDCIRQIMRLYEVNNRTAERYIHEARETYHKTDECFITDINIALGRTEYLYQKSVAGKDGSVNVNHALRSMDMAQKLRKEHRETSRNAIQIIDSENFSNTISKAISEIQNESNIGPEDSN